MSQLVPQYNRSVEFRRRNNTLDQPHAVWAQTFAHVNSPPSPPYNGSLPPISFNLAVQSRQLTKQYGLITASVLCSPPISASRSCEFMTPYIHPSQLCTWPVEPESCSGQWSVMRPYPRLSLTWLSPLQHEEACLSRGYKDRPYIQ